MILSFQVRSPVTVLKGNKSDFIISGTLSLRSPVTAPELIESLFLVNPAGMLQGGEVFG